MEDVSSYSYAASSGMRTLLCAAALLLCLQVVEGLSCTDMTKCNNYFDCSDHDAALRSGNICHDYPFYTGGYPLAKLEWLYDTKPFVCTAANPQGVCTKWTANEFSATEETTGTCECTELAATYCAKWICEQEEIDLCKDGEQDAGRSCCYETDNGRVCYRKEFEIEISNCECRDQANGACTYWYCEERDNNGLKAIEYEHYNCTKLSGLICMEWVGRINSVEEFEVCSCQCTSFDATKCNRWVCDEKSLNYEHPQIAYIALFIIVSLPAFAGIVFLVYGMKPSVICASLVAFLLLWFCGFTLLCVFLAGFHLLVIGLGICAVIWLVVDVYNACTRGRSVLKAVGSLLTLCCRSSSSEKGPTSSKVSAAMQSSSTAPPSYEDAMHMQELKSECKA